METKRNCYDVLDEVISPDNVMNIGELIALKTVTKTGAYQSAEKPLRRACKGHQLQERARLHNYRRIRPCSICNLLSVRTLRKASYRLMLRPENG